jgi:hypothetical protein
MSQNTHTCASAAAAPAAQSTPSLLPEQPAATLTALLHTVQNTKSGINKKEKRYKYNRLK